MIRYESKDLKVTIRYDGTETRVDIHRWPERKSMSKRELKKVISVLQDALAERERFDRGDK